MRTPYSSSGSWTTLSRVRIRRRKRYVLSGCIAFTFAYYTTHRALHVSHDHALPLLHEHYPERSENVVPRQISQADLVAKVAEQDRGQVPDAVVEVVTHEPHQGQQQGSRIINQIRDEDVPDFNLFNERDPPTEAPRQDAISGATLFEHDISRLTSFDTPYTFPPHEQWEELDTKAETLPDIVHIPLEAAVADQELEGWEDEWFSQGRFDSDKWGRLDEPKIDFVYTWVNGSDEAFTKTMRPFEESSTLNDPDGEWIRSHGSNRYRSWDELRYSIRSVELYAHEFRNKIQLLVNAVDRTDDPEVERYTKQRPLWLKDDDEDTDKVVQILSQEDFFGEDELGALPSFNSLTIESQLYNTPSDTDRFFAMSDDMLLGRPHSASDIYSPLFGPTLGFKSNGYNTQSAPSENDARRFGEKPYLIYTSWMLNRRFGVRKRKGQVHFGHSMSRSIAREVKEAFPRPSLKSACQRFRGETGFQLYTWYAAFHYTMERHREALLYSYIVLRSDSNHDGNLDWNERTALMHDLEEGMEQEGNSGFRKRMFYRVAEHHREAGLNPPKVNIDTQWTSLDGPSTIRDIECYEFDVNECLAPGFSSEASDAHYSSPVFNTAVIFDRVARHDPSCGDCLLKLILNRQQAGLEPLLPSAESLPGARSLILKALKRYQYTIVEPDALFMMITDAEQVEHTLINRLLRKGEGGKRQIGQLCLNDDVTTTNEDELAGLQASMLRLFKGLLPNPSRFEKVDHEHDSRDLKR